MESLPSGHLLEYNPDTIKAVRKEFNLDKPGRIEEAIDILEDWVKKQNHFSKKDFSREYLETTLITCKGMVERAKIRIDKLCTFKTLMPDFFVHTDVEKIFEVLRAHITHVHLPKLTKDNYRVYVFKLLSDDNLDSRLIFSYYKYIIMLCEYMKIHEYCNGFVIVLDLTDITIMNIVTSLNLIEFRQAFIIFMEGYGMRIKGIHFITPSKMIDALVSVFKSVLSEKLGKRIYIHKSVDTVYEHVERDILPVEYGGKERPLKTLNEAWMETLGSKPYLEYLKEMNQAKTDESCRQSNEFTESYTGMPGSFRSLSVD